MEEMSCIEYSDKVEAVETIEIWKRLVMKKAVGVHISCDNQEHGDWMWWETK